MTLNSLLNDSKSQLPHFKIIGKDSYIIELLSGINVAEHISILHSKPSVSSTSPYAALASLSSLYKLNMMWHDFHMQCFLLSVSQGAQSFKVDIIPDKLQSWSLTSMILAIILPLKKPLCSIKTSHFSSYVAMRTKKWRPWISFNTILILVRVPLRSHTASVLGQ